MNPGQLLLCLLLSCAAVVSGTTATALDQDSYAQQRERLVTQEIERAGVSDPRVLDSMRQTPRHEFMPDAVRRFAYNDVAVPIGGQQTISPPYVVAYMTEQLRPEPTDRVLEIGTGSGYQAAVLSPLVADVYTIEIVATLAHRAERTLRRLGYDNIHVRAGDGFQGWPERAPFDKIIVTCSPEQIPQPLVDQLREGGQMIIPVGERYQQNLFRVTKSDGELLREPLQATLFVPMTGTAEDARRVLPDPTDPRLVNGGFEETIGDSAEPVGWHYLRGAEVVTESQDAPEGERFLRFSVDEAGDPGRALQGLALDGRKVARVELSARLRGRGIREVDSHGIGPGVVVTFYDGRRAAIQTVGLDGWDTAATGWQSASQTLAVPLAAREAIVRVGLLGATGRLDVDLVAIRAVDH